MTNDDDEKLLQLNVKGIPRRELERYQAAAQRHQRSLSSWVRMVLAAAAGDDKGLILRVPGPGAES